MKSHAQKTHKRTKPESFRAAGRIRPQPKSPILQLQQQLGNQAIQRLLRAKNIQAKLTIGAPNDRYEQEADRVADHVMRLSDTDVIARKRHDIPPSLLKIQRLCPSSNEELQRQPAGEEEEEEEEKLQAKRISGTTAVVDNDVEQTIHNLRGGGQPLSLSTRAYLEPRFGYDFSQVRIHTDAQAGQVARAVNARAFTLGQDIVFGPGEYSPDTGKGRHLLAHELTHVLQQGGSAGIARKRIQRRELRGEDFPWQGVVANASWVWFRKNPDMAETSKIRALKAGTEVQVTGVSGNWLKLKYNGVDGYMYKNYIIHKFEVEARNKVSGLCDKTPCLTQSGCIKSNCKKEAAEITETYVNRVNKIRKPNVPNVGDIHWGWMCYQWAGLLTREFKKMSLKCWKINWVGLVGSGGSLQHNYIYVSLNDIKPTGTSAPKRDCGMIFDPWRTGDPIVYDVSWTWHKWNYIHDPSTNKGKSYDGTTWSSKSYPPPWTPPEPPHSPTIKTR